MLQIPAPGSEAAERRAGWHHLTEMFSASLREYFADERPLDFATLQQTLDKWEGFARAWDRKGLLGHPNTLDELERMRTMVWCAEYVQKTTSLPVGVPPAVMTELPPSAPREAVSRADWALACIRLFRGESPGNRIAVPIALADEMVQLKGGIATLVFDVFSPGTGRMTLHPEESFRILPDVDFTESLNTAWGLTLEIAKNAGSEGNFPDVIWRVIRESPSMSGLDENAFFKSSGLRLKGEIKGRSASGAAARAFRHVLKGTHPDPDVFVLAQVRKDGATTIQLQGVGGIRAKVEAVADTGKPAVIVVTEQDKAEADLAASKKQANARIKIEVDVPPAIEELLDDAKKLSDADRFADAIPILEEGLTAAIEAKHQNAEATIRVRLGHAQLQSKIDEARRATRKRDHDAAAQLWDDARFLAVGEGNKPAEMRARLEICLVQLRDGDDVDEVLPALNQCIHDAKHVDFGTQRARLLHLMGEAHRLKDDTDQARGFFLSSLELAPTTGQKPDEGWALLSLSMLGDSTKAKLDLIQNAYDCFSAAYASGDHELQREAKRGFAFCHSLRAAVFGPQRVDEAMAEFARALTVFGDLGADFEWDLAHALFERGDLHSRTDDASTAVKDLVSAAELFQKLGDSLFQAKCVMRLCRCFTRDATWSRGSNAMKWTAIST